MFVETELRAIASEYGSYFPRLELRTSSSELYLHITTKEEKTLRVSVCESGWFLLGGERFFQTFEALMDTELPKFRSTFAGELSDKLAALAETQ